MGRDYTGAEASEEMTFVMIPDTQYWRLPNDGGTGYTFRLLSHFAGCVDCGWRRASLAT
jgi:hypothetical protein